MRLTVGRKINAILLVLLILSIGGSVGLATELFTADLVGHLKKANLDTAALMAARVRSEMKRVSEKAQLLGAASLEEFRYPEDRLRFIRANFTQEDKFAAVGVFKVPNDPSVPPTLEWRLLQPTRSQSVQLEDFERFESEHPLDLSQARKGEAQFSLAPIKSGLSYLRLTLPLLKEKDGKISRVLVVDLHDKSFEALFSEGVNALSYLVDPSGRTLASSAPQRYPAGSELKSLRIVSEATRAEAPPSGELEFTDLSGIKQMGAYFRVGFAGLAVVSQVPASLAFTAKLKVYRRTALLAAFFLFLAVSLGLLLSSSLTAPIRRLAQAADRVRKGDFKVRIRENLNSAKQSALRRGGDEIQSFEDTFDKMVHGLEERERMGMMIDKFHHKDFAERLMAGEISLGGEKLDAVVLFTDLRGFTTFSESLKAEDLVRILNRYMSRMVSVILEHGGIVDKYVGDAIMAVWGVPVASGNDVKNAVQACLAMRKALVELNEEFSREGVPVFKIGMGLNYGPLVAGNIGSEERMEYTVVGDTVNTASRLQDLTKLYGTDLLVSASVADAVPNLFLWELHENVALRGKRERINVLKVLGYRNDQGAEIRVETPYSHEDTAPIVNKDDEAA